MTSIIPVGGVGKGGFELEIKRLDGGECAARLGPLPRKYGTVEYISCVGDESAYEVFGLKKYCKFDIRRIIYTVAFVAEW